ncbi:hypothetical protein ONZ45_g4608 [Pleurotus djamor]|nr:hypothetical protein ONZ45_g4608 [Pleurotus djamor]
MSTSNLEPIVFYDIPTTAGPGPSFSPNTLRIRWILNYKGIPYTTTYVEYPDIEATCKRIGALPTTLMPNGQLLYTLPAIHDPSTNTTLADGQKIAEYLDKTYPSAPPVFPNNTLGLQLAVCDGINKRFMAVYPIFAPRVHHVLNPRSAEYWHHTRSAFFGKKYEDIAPRGTEKAQLMTKIKESMDEVAGWLDKTEATIFVGSKIVFGEESEEWAEMKGWSEGRWVALVRALEKYHA